MFVVAFTYFWRRSIHIKMAKVKKKELGLGIRALLGNSNPQDPVENKKVVKALSSATAMIPMDQISANPGQPRKDFDQEALEELAASIKVHGIIQPITLRSTGVDTYEIISGERRFRASQIAGLLEVPAYVRIANDQELLEMALIENIQRADLNPLEIAITYSRLMSEFDLTHEAMAERVGKKRSTITNSLRILELPPSIQTGLRTGQISAGHAKALQGLDTVDKQLALYQRIIKEKLSVRETEKAVQMKNIKPGSGAANKELSIEYRDVRRNLRKQLGSKVEIKMKGRDKGQIIIPFTDVDEFNRLLEIIED